MALLPWAAGHSRLWLRSAAASAAAAPARLQLSSGAASGRDRDDAAAAQILGPAQNCTTGSSLPWQQHTSIITTLAEGSVIAASWQPSTCLSVAWLLHGGCTAGGRVGGGGSDGERHHQRCWPEQQTLQPQPSQQHAARRDWRRHPLLQWWPHLQQHRHPSHQQPRPSPDLLRQAAVTAVQPADCAVPLLLSTHQYWQQQSRRGCSSMAAPPPTSQQQQDVPQSLTTDDAATVQQQQVGQQKQGQQHNAAVQQQQGQQKLRQWQQHTKTSLSPRHHEGGGATTQHPPPAWLQSSKRVPNGTWQDPAKRREYMDWLGRAVLGVRPGHHEDWYALTAQHFHDHRGGGACTSVFNHSPTAALQDAYPDVNWLPWLFKRAPQNTWDDHATCRRYLEWLGQRLGYTYLDDWYKVTVRDFKDNHGAGLLFSTKHNGSPLALLQHVYPQHQWLPWLFKHQPRGWARDPTAACQFVEWLGQQRRGCRPGHLDDLRRLTERDFRECGGSTVLKQHGGADSSVGSMLRVLYPEHIWD